MQKVEGSSPFIRFKKFLEISRFSRPASKRPRSVARFVVAVARADGSRIASTLRRAPGGNRGTKVPQIGQPHPRPVQDGVDARSQFASISPGGLASVYRRSCLQKVMSVRQSRRVEHSASRSDPVPGQFGAERIDVGCYLMCAFR